MIMLSPRHDTRDYFLKLTSLGHAHFAVEMHRTVQAVGEWVAGLHEDARIMERKLRERGDYSYVKLHSSSLKSQNLASFPQK